MNAHKAIGAIGALMISTFAFAGQSVPPPAPVSIHIGQMKNSGWGTISYSGDYREHVTAEKVPASNNTFPTLINVDLSAILTENGFSVFRSVTIVDSGLNSYGASPGADIDYFAFSGLPGGATYEFDYDGVNPTHVNEAAALLATRENSIDTSSGASDANALLFVSLGMNGKLTANMDGWIGSGGGGGNGPAVPTGQTGGMSLHISEAGSGESFDLYVTAANVPAPGALALLGMAGIVGRRGRRRR